jgi:acetyl-CoA acetyltransferase family protein
VSKVLEAFMTDIFLSLGVRTPFVKAGTFFAKNTALELSAPVVQAMKAKATPDFLIWGQVIPDAGVSNIARELVFEGGLDPDTPAFTTVMACSTSFVGTIEAAGMVGESDMHLALVGGAETMSRIPIALKGEVADRIFANFAKNPAESLNIISHVKPDDFALPTHGWANRQSGKSMGDHTEDTAKYFHITREEQDARALFSHQRAIAGQDSGFFKDLVIPFGGVDHDTIPRRDTSAEKLATLKPAFDKTSGNGTLTAGNSSPNTDGASSIWVGDAQGMKKLGATPTVRLVDWEITAMDFRKSEEGILMAPGRAIPRLLARNKLKFKDFALWEIHEAFAAQVEAHIKAITDLKYVREKAKVDFDFGEFPRERVNPNGGSVALGHPFAATGSRILSQATKELSAMPSGSRALVSVCADGGQGTVAVLERV